MLDRLLDIAADLRVGNRVGDLDLAGSVSIAALISSSVPITMSVSRRAERMATPKARGSCHWSGRKSMSSTTSAPGCDGPVPPRTASRCGWDPGTGSCRRTETPCSGRSGLASTSSMVSAMSAQFSR